MMMMGESGRRDDRWQSIGEGLRVRAPAAVYTGKKMESDATDLAYGVFKGRDGFMMRVEVVG